jgi:hypothetical protein
MDSRNKIIKEKIERMSKIHEWTDKKKEVRRNIWIEATNDLAEILRNNIHNNEIDEVVGGEIITYIKRPS